MERDLFGEDHDLFRQAFRQFVDREVVPNEARWNQAGIEDRSAWRAAGRAGFLCPWMEERWGGPGADFLCSVVIMEEMAGV